MAAPDAYSRECLVRAVGDDVVATGLEYLPNAVRSLQPDAIVIDAGGDSERARTALLRARGAVESAIPAVLMVSNDSLWLHGASPEDLRPCVVIPRDSVMPGLSGALARLAGESPPAVGTIDVSEIEWHADRRELAGPLGTVRLTVSESRIFDAVFTARGALVPADQIATSLWGQPLADPLSRAAIRSHVYTLRKKMRSIGLEGVLMSLAGSGYQLRPLTPA